MASYLVFAGGERPSGAAQLPAGYHARLWRPALTAVRPPGPFAPALPLLWWMAHHGRLFRNRDYSVLTIHAGEMVVHRSVAFPAYFTFPFMESRDVQIGYTWTAPTHRGRGLATRAIEELMHALAEPDRRFWYLTDSMNAPSMRAAQAAGMRHVAFARRSVPAGVRAIGRYSITSWTDDDAASTSSAVNAEHD